MRMCNFERNQQWGYKSADSGISTPLALLPVLILSAFDCSACGADFIFPSQLHVIHFMICIKSINTYIYVLDFLELILQILGQLVCAFDGAPLAGQVL